MFHPLPPSPCFLYLWPALQAIEVIYDAISKALPEGGAGVLGRRSLRHRVVGHARGQRRAVGRRLAHPVGQGGHAGGDGGTLMHICESATRFSPVEVWEARNPWLLEKVELAPDSCGPGRHRGGLGVDFFFHMLEEAYVTPHIERTKTPPWGLEGGGEGRPNLGVVRYPDGSRIEFGKKTRLKVPTGATFELYCGGGGGYGLAAERPAESVHADLREGYITEAHAREHYPHAFADAEARTAAE